MYTKASFAERDINLYLSSKGGDKDDKAKSSK
jgi:hypothetical protein